MKTLGLITIGIGICLIGGGLTYAPGGILSNLFFGTDRMSVLTMEYKEAKSENRKPTLDQQLAYSCNRFIKTGRFIFILGSAIFIIQLVL